MELSVSAALRQVGEVFSFTKAETFQTQEFGGREIVFLSPVSVTGTFAFDGKAVSLQCSVNVLLSSVCARCGETFEEPVQFQMSESFVKNMDEQEDSDAYPFSGDILNLDVAILDNLFLSLPIVSVCKPECKGVCPVCGTNRNIRECGCIIPDPANPFSVLQSVISNEIKEV